MIYLFLLCGAASGGLVALAACLAVSSLLKRSFLDAQLDELVVTFQEEIPMAAMFLKGRMLERLKARAGDKLMGMFSKIKNKFIWIILAGIFVGFLVGLLFSGISVNVLTQKGV